MAEKASKNDLDKDLAAGNEAVQDYLNKQSVKQGYFNPDDKSIDKKLQEQNDPKHVEIKDHSANLTALEVAEGAVEDKKKK